uniref:Do family serine endopeptidase n=1 Tax=uncultured Dysgonomonas sp. TaxID=206096 RepID=UPI002620E327|nr:Do family serine endopeptidase [uncultured Dysgonomonas sp.]
MKKIWKNASTYIVAALISIGASYGTYSYLNSRANYSSADIFNYGQEFDQKNVHLASLTADGYPDFTKAAESSIHAVVHIKSTVKSVETAGRRQRQMIDPFEYFFGFGDRGGSEYMNPQPSVGYGSGVIISKDGYIITNNHVIDKATEIEVTMNDNQKYVAKLIGTDPTTDIALLKIEGTDFPYVSFGNSDDLKVGEWVLAVGNPFNLTSTVTAGIVSAKGRGGIGAGKQGGGDMTIQSFIQTDAAINPGNSGGALVNTNGQLVGINTAIYSQTGSFAGYGFAVPISIAGKVVADIKEFGAVQRAVLGVMISDVSAVDDINPEKAKALKVKEGVYVGGFADRSPAKEAGVLEGDVIVAVNKTKVRSVGELQDQVNRYRPGDKVELAINRNGDSKTVSVVLKNSSGSTSVVKKTDGLAAVGAAFKKLTEEQKKQYGVSYGVEVAGVDDGGKFKKEGISKGFIIMKINNASVSSPDEVEQIIDAVSKSQDKGLFVSGFYPNGRTKYYAIDLNE